MTTWTRTLGLKRCGHYSRGASKLLSPRRSQPAQYVWMFVKLIAAFSPIWAILAVLMSAWEDEEAEKLKRSKKADFTFDSPE